MANSTSTQTDVEGRAEAQQRDDAKSLGDYIGQYWPVILLALYSLAAAVLFAAARESGVRGGMHYFMAVFLAGFSFFKLLDLPGFADSYAAYDILAGRFKPYGYIYPFLELGLAALYATLMIPTITYIATIALMAVGSIGVIRAVARGKDIHCGCMGTMLDLPMGPVTIVEDVGMGLMALVMLISLFMGGS